MKKVHTRTKRKRQMHTHKSGAKALKTTKLKLANNNAAKNKKK